MTDETADQAAIVALVRQCLEGDEASWRAFVERFQQPVFALCLRMLRHRQDAEDVTQVSLVRAVRHLDQWDQSRPIFPWLMTIAANRCRTALERRSRRPVTSEFPIDPESDERSPSATGVGEEIERALGQLREEYRECFILFYQQELSCAEVSEIMGCPVGTVKTWLHRARHEVAEQLTRRGITGETINELR